MGTVVHEAQIENSMVVGPMHELDGCPTGKCEKCGRVEDLEKSTIGDQEMMACSVCIEAERQRVAGIELRKGWRDELRHAKTGDLAVFDTNFGSRFVLAVEKSYAKTGRLEGTVTEFSGSGTLVKLGVDDVTGWCEQRFPESVENFQLIPYEA